MLAAYGNMLRSHSFRADTVFSNKLVVFPLSIDAGLRCAPISRPRGLGTFLWLVDEGRLRYTPSDCFETFPFPENCETDPALEAAGKAYYEFRADLMVRNNEGLTKTYNRFHDPDERDPDILKLRELHAAMDRAVLDAYGWTDIPTDCEFLLDYEDDEEEVGGRQEEAVALPLARRVPRRGAGPAARAERRTREAEKRLGGAAEGKSPSAKARRRARRKSRPRASSDGTTRAELPPTTPLEVRERLVEASSSTSSARGRGTRSPTSGCPAGCDPRTGT